VVHAAEKLLDDFRTLPSRVERPRTFMEIAGYPHYENVCSNILAFFMDPEESHGFGTLVLDALMSAGDSIEADKGIGGNVSVEREVITDKGRIDILIASDDHAILIENKIHAGVSNPFDDYADYLDHIADDRPKHKFLLTLYPTSEGSEWGFTNLTHEEFVGQIRSLLGHYVSDANARYLTMFLDFLNTLEDLRKGTRMNQEFLKLLSEQKDAVEDFLSEIKGFEDELRKKVRELGAGLEVEEHPNVHQWFYREKTTLFDCLVHDIRIAGDLPVFIDTIVSPHKWEIQISVRRGGDSSKLRDLLHQLEIPFEEEGHFVHPARFAYDEDLEQIRLVLQELVDKLATHRGA